MDKGKETLLMDNAHGFVISEDRRTMAVLCEDEAGGYCIRAYEAGAKPAPHDSGEHHTQGGLGGGGIASALSCLVG